jgi:hypothetical protein
MLQRLIPLSAILCLLAFTATAEDLLRMCAAYYPGGCSLHIFDYTGTAYDFHSLWCGDELIYETGGLGGLIGSHGNCRYFV